MLLDRILELAAYKKDVPRSDRTSYSCLVTLCHLVHDSASRAALLSHDEPLRDKLLDCLIASAASTALQVSPLPG